MASKNLEHLGAKVFKIEQVDDSFKTENLQIFQDWYQSFNEGKEIIKDVPHLNPDIILAYSPKQFEGHDHATKILIKGGDKEFKYLHDLNALAFSKTFQVILKNNTQLPELPYAGICYGLYISSVALAGHMKGDKSIQEVYLKDFTQYFFNLFYSEALENDRELLHKGHFPCYAFYQTEDNKIVCFAAVEDKFWTQFAILAGLDLSSKDRFDTSGRVKSIISEFFESLQSEKLSELLREKHLCINLIL